MFSVLKHPLYGYVLRLYQTNITGKKTKKIEHQRILKIVFPVNEKGHLSEKPEISTGYLEQLERVTYIITQTKNGARPHIGALEQISACS